MSNAAISLSIDRISRADDPKSGLLEAITQRAIDGFKLYEDDVLLGTYVRPEKTKGGIILTSKSKDEDRFQGKVGLLLKTGPSAFKYDRSGAYDYEGVKPVVGEWQIYRPSDGWEISLNGVSCRLIRASMLRGSIADPESIW